jgi:hypothetical protein
MIRRHTVVAFVLAALSLGCDKAKREKAVADSLIAVAAAADSASRAAAADSARRVDSLAAAAASKAKAPAKRVAPKGTTGGAILGRDSVIMNHKAIALPIVADTAKRRPPR